MATYNTAFGSLPGVETLTGYRQTDEDEERPRDYTQQYRAQQQAQPRQQQEEQPRTPTFAEMQAAGQARPAPSQLAPMPSQITGATGQAPAQPPMLDQLRGALGGLAAAAPAPAAAMPVTTTQPTLSGAGGGRFGLGGPVAPGDIADAIAQQGGPAGGGRQRA